MRAIRNAALITAVCCALVLSFSEPSAARGNENSDVTLRTAPGETAKKVRPADEKMLLTPGADCDPQMLIPVEPGGDPGFSLNPRP